MADTVVSSATHGLLDLYEGPKGPYWIDINTAVIVFINSSNELTARRTTNAGSSWGSDITISTTYAQKMACWFDQETPGDSGTLVHVVWIDDTNSDLRYRTIDVSDGSLGTERIAVSTITSSATEGRDRLSITKNRDGKLYLLGLTNGGTSNVFYYSTDNGANWFSRADCYDASQTSGNEDYAMLFPANTADEDDVCAVYWDAGDSAITIKMYDWSANAWTESGSFQAAINSTTYPFWDASIRHSDSHIIFTYWNDSGTSTSDLLCYDINPNSIASPSVTQKTNIVTNSEGGYPGVIIDQNTDDIYVGYAIGTLFATTDAVYQKSVDGGTTWGGATDYSEAIADDVRAIAGGRIIGTGGGRIQFVFYNDDLTNIYVNLVNDIEIAITQIISPTGFQATGTFGTTELTVRLSPTGFQATGTFGTANQFLQFKPTGFQATGTFGSPDVLTGAINATGFQAVGTFGDAFVVPGNVIKPHGFTPPFTAGTPSLNRTILPTGIEATTTMPEPAFGIGINTTGFQPTVTFGTSYFNPLLAGFQATVTAGSPTVFVYGIITATGFAGTTTMGSPMFNPLMDGFQNTVAMGVPTLVTGDPQTISPTGFQARGVFSWGIPTEDWVPVSEPTKTDWVDI